MLVTVWAGSLWTVGFLVAPLLFATLSNRALAGEIARQMFASVEYLGLICGLLLMILMRIGSGRWLADVGARLAGIMLILTTVSLLVIDPWLDRLRDTAGASSSAFVYAHAVASGVYVIVCALALGLVLQRDREQFTAG